MKTKTIKEVWDFCNKFTSWSHYFFERVLELNHIRDYIIIVLSEGDFKHEDFRIRVMGIIDDFSLQVKDGFVKNFVYDLSNSRVAILQMLCLECLPREEKYNEKMPNFIIDGKEVSSHDETEFFFCNFLNNFK